MVAENDVVWVGLGVTRRPMDGDPMAYLARRIGEEQFHYAEPVIEPTVGVRYYVSGQCEGFMLSFRATLTKMYDDEDRSGLEYVFDNGVCMSGDPVFMPEDYEADLDDPVWSLSAKHA